MHKKKATMTIRLDSTEKMRIKRCARETAQSMSEYVMEAVRERLERDEVPVEERSDLDLMQAALRRERPPEVSDKPDPELEKKSLDELIKDYVNGDDSVC